MLHVAVTCCAEQYALRLNNRIIRVAALPCRPVCCPPRSCQAYLLCAVPCGPHDHHPTRRGALHRCAPQSPSRLCPCCASISCTMHFHTVVHCNHLTGCGSLLCFCSSWSFAQACRQPQILWLEAAAVVCAMLSTTLVDSTVQAGRCRSRKTTHAKQAGCDAFAPMAGVTCRQYHEGLHVIV